MGPMTSAPIEPANNMEDIQHIIHRCTKNDPRAQGLLYERYKSQLMGVCLRYAANLQEAEDIFQEAFYAILKHIGKAEGYDNIFTWMRRIAINKAINYHKKNSRHHLHASTSDGDMTDVSNSNFQAIESQFDTQQLLDAVNELPAGYRVVFNMYVIDGYSHKEIGENLNVSENTSKSQLFKAKAMLRKKLEILNKISYEKS